MGHNKDRCSTYPAEKKKNNVKLQICAVKMQK